MSKDILEALLEAISNMSQPAREGLFQLLRDRWCMYCGADCATYKCYCHARGEDV